jgi:hypothetical protein
MQEDKLGKWLASSLRQAQEENPLPYQIGAWEAFEKRRKERKNRALAYWVSGIAASLLVLIVAFNSLDFSSIEKTDQLSSRSVAGETLPESVSVSPSSGVPIPSNTDTSLEPTQGKLLGEDQSFSIPKEKDEISTSRSPKGIVPQKSVGNGPASTLIQGGDKKLQAMEKEHNSDQVVPLIPNEIPNKNTLNTALASAQADSLEKARVDLLKKQIAELTGANEAVETKTQSSPLALALGLAPGFGAAEQDNQQISGSSMGLGVQMNLDLGEKLVLGSGMGVNYFSQTSRGQNTLRIANAAYAGNEKIEVQQVQVDIPLYLSYPITRNRSVTVQAGFSNLVAFNQSSEKEFSYKRQVTVIDSESSLANSFTFQSESVTNYSEIDTPNSKFYPLATANLGLNIRVMESDKTSYFLMPFYNYPIQDISGTGSNIGFFGAALKVNFGAIQKK